MNYNFNNKKIKNKLLSTDYEDWLVETVGKAKGKGESTKQEKLTQDLPLEECEDWSFPGDKGRTHNSFISSVS